MKMAWGEMLALSGGIAFSPIPIAAVILILMTPQGRRNSLAFVVGWLLGLSSLLLAVMQVVGRIDAAGGPRFPWIGPSLQVLFGLLLWALAFRIWRSRPRGEEREKTPVWMEKLDQFGWAKSLSLAVVLGVANLKNLPITVQAGILVSRGPDWGEGRWLLILLFLAVGLLGVGAPLVVAALFPRRSDEVLRTWRRWLCRHNALVLNCLFAGIGAMLLFKGGIALWPE